MAVTISNAGELTTALVRLIRLMMARERQLPRMHERVDSLTQPLVFKLADGPLRVSELADLTHSELSTVSRHVSNLERCGFVVKLPDPADGRAAQVSLTEVGRQTVARARAANAQRMSQILRGWDDPQVSLLTRLLNRLATDIEATPVTGAQTASSAMKGTQ